MNIGEIKVDERELIAGEVFHECSNELGGVGCERCPMEQACNAYYNRVVVNCWKLSMIPDPDTIKAQLAKFRAGIVEPEPVKGLSAYSDDDVVSISGAAGLMNLGHERIYSLVKARRLDSVKVKGRLFVRVASIKQYLREF